MQYNPLLLNIEINIEKHLPLLHSSHKILQFFDIVNVTYRRIENLKELMSHLYFLIQ